MCTVTYISKPNGFCLTSSRDEKVFRPTIAPDYYNIDGDTLLYPKDLLAGGTWIAVSKKERLACLLNGAFKKHQKQETYSRSRGTVLLESFTYQNILSFIYKVNLVDVEPFTLLLIEHSNAVLTEFYELRWDGINKYLNKIDETISSIWSSSTLYSEEITTQREILFKQWLEKYKEFPDNNILNFHNQKHGLDNKDDLIMERDNGLKTLSISQIIVESGLITFNYHNLEERKIYKKSFQPFEYYA